jgi:hypothetical protein
MSEGCAARWFARCALLGETADGKVAAIAAAASAAAVNARVKPIDRLRNLGDIAVPLFYWFADPWSAAIL